MHSLLEFLLLLWFAFVVLGLICHVWFETGEWWRKHFPPPPPPPVNPRICPVCGAAKPADESCACWHRRPPPHQ